MSNTIDKALLLVLFPFFTIALLIGFVTFYTRRGRPVSLKLKGLGITFELRSSHTTTETSEDVTE